MKKQEKEKRSEKPEMYHHNVDENGRRYTLAAVPIDNEGVVVVKIGAAVCSDNDNFCKKIGRLIAGGRATVNPVTLVVIEDKEKYRDTVYSAFVEIDTQAKEDARVLWQRNREVAQA